MPPIVPQKGAEEKTVPRLYHKVQMNILASNKADGINKTRLLCNLVYLRGGGDGLDLDLRHGGASAAEVSLLGLGILGVVV